MQCQGPSESEMCSELSSGIEVTEMINIFLSQIFHLRHETALNNLCVHWVTNTILNIIQKWGNTTFYSSIWANFIWVSITHFWITAFSEISKRIQKYYWLPQALYDLPSAAPHTHQAILLKASGLHKKAYVQTYCDMESYIKLLLSKMFLFILCYILYLLFKFWLCEICGI